MNTSNVPRVSVLGVPVDLFTSKEFVDFLVCSAAKAAKTVVGYANIYEVNLALKDPEHKVFLDAADAVFLDGFGLFLGAKLLGHAVTPAHRLTGPEFLEPLVRECEKRGLSLYVLGGEPHVLDAAVQKIRRFAPALKLAGHHGYFPKSGPQNDAVIDDINRNRPDVLYVGFGSPIQERWIAANMDRITARVFLPMGAGLDYYTGIKRRGPQWLTDRGLEWLCRLVLEPKRLWRRYLVGNPMFFFRIGCYLLGNAIGRPRPSRRSHNQA